MHSLNSWGSILKPPLRLTALDLNSVTHTIITVAIRRQWDLSQVHLYMSSTSAPSTTTSSSLSRADSLSSMEYLQGTRPHHLHHGTLSGTLSHRSGSTTTGSTTESSYGYSLTSGSGGSSTSGGHSFHLQHPHHHHSTGLGRANLNAAIHQHQLHRQPHHISGASSSPSSNTRTKPGTGSSSRATGDSSSATSGNVQGSGTGSGKTRLASGTAGSEQQGRNSTKRAAQNRAAQRAFRQRKDLYVRDLERKADLLQQAEGKIMQLTARNRELEAALANQSSASCSSSPLLQPPHSPFTPNASSMPSGHSPAVTESTTPVDRDRMQDREAMDYRGSSSTDSGDDYGIVHRRPDREGRSGSIDMKGDSHLSARGPHHHHSPVHSDHVDTPSSTLQTRQTGAPHERPPLYPISTTPTQQGPKPGLISSSALSNPPLAKSWPHQMDEGAKSASLSSPMTPTGGIASANSPSGRLGGHSDYFQHTHQQPHHYQRPQDGELEYMSDERSDHGRGADRYNVIKKRPSDISIRRGGDSRQPGSPSCAIAEPPVSPRFAPPHHIQRELRKQASWSAFSTHRPMNLPPVFSLTGARSPSTGDTDMQESFQHSSMSHQHPQQQHTPHRHLHHRASTGSVSVRDTDKRPLGVRALGVNSSRMMMDSPEMSSSDTKFGCGSELGAAPVTPQSMHHQQDYFSSLEQQHRKIQQQQPRRYPESPVQEYPPSNYSSSPRSQGYPPQQQTQHRSGYGQGVYEHEHSPRRQEFGDKYSRADTVGGSDMEAVYEPPRNQPSHSDVHGTGYNNETSMRSP
ncbi:hypothetical protein EDD11_007976 [Mortierella claussenii]|nr:hypothetical protein EDD11_007976 [Mortierella claussenii]